MSSMDEPPEVAKLKPGGKLGFVWDGCYWRVLLSGACPRGPDVTYVSSTGVCEMWDDSTGRPSTGFSVDPINNVRVLEFARRECGKAGCSPEGPCRGHRF